MHDVAWRGMWICVPSKDVQKQLVQTSLNGLKTDLTLLFTVETDTKRIENAFKPFNGYPLVYVFPNQVTNVCFFATIHSIMVFSFFFPFFLIFLEYPLFGSWHKYLPGVDHQWVS